MTGQITKYMKYKWRVHNQEKWARVTAGGKHLIKSTRSSVIRHLFLGRVTEFTHCLTARFPTVVPLEEKQFFLCYHVCRTLWHFALTEQRNIFKKHCVERWHKAKCMTSITLNDKVITVSGVYALMTLRRNNRHLSSTDTESTSKQHSTSASV